MDAAQPTRLTIPTLGVSTPLIRLGLQRDGTMEVPQQPGKAGWYTKAPAPGALGPAVIAGHVDLNGQPGVFFDLAALTSGDHVKVDRADGSTAVFTVTGVRQYPKQAFPTTDVYGTIDHAGLRLITCGGEFNQQTGHYNDNIIVFAKLTHPTPAPAK